MIKIENGQFKILLGFIKTALDKPGNSAAVFQGKQAVNTLEDYLKAAQEPVHLCDECGAKVPDGQVDWTGAWHFDSCSLHSGNIQGPR